MGKCLERYIEEYIHRLKHSKRETDRARALRGRSIAHRIMATIRPKDIADFRRERKEEGVSGNTIRLDFTLLSKLFNHACSNDWSMKSLQNPFQLAYRLYTDHPKCTPQKYGVSYIQQGVMHFCTIFDTDTTRWVTSDYFATEWLPVGSKRIAMTVALHLGGLYEQLLHRLISLPTRPQETQAELDKTTAPLEKEKPFNRKVAINVQLKELKKDHEALIR